MKRRLPPGAHIAPMPPLAVVETVGTVLPGGLPPNPNRNQNNWLKANRRASEPFVSRAIRLEILTTRANLR
jgi:hypothetical protein